MDRPNPSFSRPQRRFLAGLLGLALAGCSASGSPSSFEEEAAGAGAGPAAATGTGGGTATSTSTGVGGAFTGSGGSTGAGGTNEIAEVFGESAENLYKLDPKTKAVTVVGPFKDCFPVIDIAVDKDSNLYATTYEGLFKVDKTTAQCTQIANSGFPNSLSFVPAGTVDPNEEALVGYAGSTYVRIDTTTGAITNIGELTGGYSSSGDIVSVKNGKTLLTVKGDGCGINDCLLEVDPTTGDLIKNWGQLPYADVFGLAFWAGTAYGFSQDGVLFEVTFANNTIATSAIPIPNPPASLYFWGAGSTTSAPPDPIPE